MRTILKSSLVLVTNELTQIIGGNNRRNYLGFQNNGSVTVYLGFGVQPLVSGANAYQLTPNMVLLFDGDVCPVNEIYAVANSQCAISVMEGLEPV